MYRQNHYQVLAELSPDTMWDFDSESSFTGLLPGEKCDQEEFEETGRLPTLEKSVNRRGTLPYRIEQLDVLDEILAREYCQESLLINQPPVTTPNTVAQLKP